MGRLFDIRMTYRPMHIGSTFKHQAINWHLSLQGISGRYKVHNNIYINMQPIMFNKDKFFITFNNFKTVNLWLQVNLEKYSKYIPPKQSQEDLYIKDS